MNHQYSVAGWKVDLLFYTAQIQGGRGRQEDTLLTRIYRQGLVVVLADGMGGHWDGDQASGIAVATASAQLRLDRMPPTRSIEHCLWNAFVAADAAVLNFGKVDRGQPGSTLVTGVFHPQSAQFHAAYVGDSLCYRQRGTELTPLFLPKLKENGQSLAIGHGIHQHGKTLGTTIQVLKPPLELQPGDRYLFASDGLEAIDLEDIREYLHLPARDAVERMIGAFIARKDLHADNLSITVVEILPPNSLR